MWGSTSKIGDADAPLLFAVFVLVVFWERVLFGVAMFGFASAAWLLFVLRRPGFDSEPSSSDNGRIGMGRPDKSWRTDPRQFFLPTTYFWCCSSGSSPRATDSSRSHRVRRRRYGYSLSVAGVDIEPESIANFYFAVLLVSAAASQLVSRVLADRFDHRAFLVAYLGPSTVDLLLLSVLTLTPIALLAVFAVVGSSIFGLNPLRDALVSDISADNYEG